MPWNSSDPSTAVERRLGHVRMDDNQRSSYQARELKTVQLDDISACSVRFVLDQCHVNEHNIYNQVGLMAINMTGHPIAGAVNEYHKAHDSERVQSQMFDLQLEFQVDPKTAERIYQLHSQKQDAVEREDYDEAKRLKDCICRLKQVGQKLAQLEAQKKAAVEREDYELAKQIKIDADRLRAAGEATAGAPGQSPVRMGSHPDEIFSRVLQPQVGKAASAPTKVDLIPQPEGDQNTADNFHNPASDNHSPGIDGGAHEGPWHEEVPATVNTNNGSYNEEPSPAAPVHPPAGFATVLEEEQVLETPPPLSNAVASDADHLVETFGEYIGRCVFSPNWQHRQAAARFMVKEVENGRVQDLRALVRYVVKGFKDKVAAVVLEASRLMQHIVTKGSRISPAVVSAVLPALLDRLSDGNTRIAEVMKQGVVFLATNVRAETVPHLPQLLKAPKNSVQWKPLLVRLEVLEQLIPDVTVGKDKNQLPLRDVMNLLGAAAKSANGTVRAAAVRIIALVVQQVGPSATNALPPDLNPKVFEAIANNTGIDLGTLKGNESLPATNPTLAVPTRPSKPRSAHAAKSAKAARPPSSAQAPKTATYSPSPSPDYYDVPESDHQTSDVAEFERDLAMKQAQYGPDHPLVADCLSNMAIIYNQRGEQDKALPMYERALKIFEQSKGHNSQDVAHTLTDMAVLHLEAHRDDIGRPLLERALEIQRQRLGDDHPDVTAILDVLNGD